MNGKQKPVADQEKTADTSKKHSKHFLVVYIIGLFSIALVLILLSYLTQVRADRQLQTLSDQLTKQTSAAQGATQKMNVLQDTTEAQEKKLEDLQKKLDSISSLTTGLGLQGQATKRDTAAEIKLLRDRYLALDALQQIRRAMASGDTATAKQIMDKMIAAYGIENLTNGRGDQAVLLGANASEFVSDKAALEKESKEN